MTLTLDFQGQILKNLYLRNGRVNWHETKVMWINRILEPGPTVWPWAITLTLVFRGNFKKKNCIAGMVVKGWVDWHGMEGMWAGYDVGPTMQPWTLISTMTLHWILVFFQGQILRLLYYKNEWADWYETIKYMNRKDDSYLVWPYPWPWPWIFKVTFWNY